MQECYIKHCDNKADNNAVSGEPLCAKCYKKYNEYREERRKFIATHGVGALRPLTKEMIAEVNIEIREALKPIREQLKTDIANVILEQAPMVSQH